MRSEIISQERLDGRLHVWARWLLSGQEVLDYARHGLPAAGDEFVLAQTHHILSAARSATRGQRIKKDAQGHRLHQDGFAYDPRADPDRSDPRLWRWRSRRRGRDWVRDDDTRVTPFRFIPTNHWDEAVGEEEEFDPQWQREVYTRDPNDAVQEVLAWKAGLLQRQLENGDRIAPVQNTTLNLQVGASGDDGCYSDQCGSGSYFADSDPHVWVGHSGGSEDIVNGWFMFNCVSCLGGQSITSATFSIEDPCPCGNDVQTKIFAEDTATPSVPTSTTDGTNKTRTTAGVDWDCPSGDGFITSPSIVSVIQELADGYDPSSIQILYDDDGSGTGGSNHIRPSAYDCCTATAAKLDICHETADTSDVEFAAHMHVEMPIQLRRLAVPYA